MSRNAVKISSVLVMLLGLTLLYAAKGFTGSARNERQAPDQSKPSSVTVTGCLSKGDGENDFTITAADGKKYDVKSDKVALKGHVGHTITVTGTLTKADADEDEDEADEGGSLNVTSLKMVSTTCKSKSAG